MVIETETVIAIRCSTCGKMEYHPISRFNFNGENNIKINCSCGALKVIVGTKNRKQYWLQIPCVLCETNHLIYYKAKQLWSDEVTFFYCTETNVELGFFGPQEKVKLVGENYEHNLETLVDELGYDEYFYNPEIMVEVLNCLHDIAEEGLLYCECGNYQIEVDIFPDRIELQCKECDSISIIYAETEEDLKTIREVEKIELARNGFKCMDSLNINNKTKKKGRKRTKR